MVLDPFLVDGDVTLDEMEFRIVEQCADALRLQVHAVDMPFGIGKNVLAQMMPDEAVDAENEHVFQDKPLGACLSILREPRWQGEGADARRVAPPVVVPRASRATPQTPLSLPTLRDRADFPSCGVVASLLGAYPTASAPPCLRGNLPRSRPRRILRQAPETFKSTRAAGSTRPAARRPGPRGAPSRQVRES